MAVQRHLMAAGLFLMAPIVLALGLCATVLYTAAGPLVPALHSYWIWIHVTAMTVAIGSYIVAATFTVLYLVADRHARKQATSPDGAGLDQEDDDPLAAAEPLGTNEAASPPDSAGLPGRADQEG